MNRIFTSESVTEGHPDKIADTISDAILDSALEQDPNSRVACETFTNTGMVLVAVRLPPRAIWIFPKLPAIQSGRLVIQAPAWALTLIPVRF